MTLVEHAEASVRDVLTANVRIPSEIFEIGGFCGTYLRHLVNRLCRPPVTRYLEIGVLHGATLCSAVAGNRVRATGIDNFSNAGFGGSEAAARKNLRRFQGESDVSLWNRDAFTTPPRFLGDPFQVFFYDADHTEDATARALTHFLPALADPFILLMDDYQRPEVRRGTLRGKEDARLDELWALEFPAEDGTTWLNGLYIGVLQRR